MESQSTGFPQFSLLPPEIRLQIWFYCLPHRVVQRDDPLCLDEVRDQQKCWSIRPTRQNAAPPLIASVCRESRHVVRKSGKMVMQDYWFNMGPIWIQPLLDGYHLNCDSMYCWEDTNLLIINMFLQEGFCRLPTMPLSLRAECFFPFSLDPLQELDDLPEYPHIEIEEDPYDGPRADDPFNVFTIFSEEPYSKLSLSATLTFICIHATKKHAADSGLFGVLLDAPVQLVDYDDEDKLRKFHALFEKGCSNHKRPEVSKQFASILAPDFQRQVQVWREKVDWLMMANAWLRVEYSTFSPIHGGSGLVWKPHLLDDQIKIYMKSEAPQQEMMFDDDHPWVKKTKEELPRVTPKIQFLLCTDECDVDGNVGMVQPMLIPRSGQSAWDRPITPTFEDLSELE